MANDEDEVLAMLVRSYEGLLADRKRIDDKVQALNMAYELLAGRGIADAVPATNGKRRKRKLQKNGKRADMHGYENTHKAFKLGEVVGRRAVAKAMGMTLAGAATRLNRMVALGYCDRVGRGLYQMKAKP